MSQVMAATAVPRGFPLHFRRAPELAIPPDDGAIEQAALREIGEQGRHALIHLRQFAAHGLEIQLVGVPSAVVVDGDVGNAALHQAARHQAGLAEGVAAIQVAQVVLLLGEIEDLTGVAENQFVGLVLGLFGGGQLRIAGQRVGQGVELVQVLAAILLALVGDALRHHAFHGKAGLGGVTAGGEWSVTRAQKAGFVEAPLRLGEHDVGGGETLGAARDRLGALPFDRAELQTVVDNGKVRGVEGRRANTASRLIEDFMIGANEVMAQTLRAAGVASIRRIVKVPERWPRMVELAAHYGDHLPAEADAAALNAFMVRRKQADPVHFADVSLSILKLMGPGEYVASRPGAEVEGHFGLAAHDYTHSTAPNRRFADLVTQRLLKALLAHQAAPYTDEELDEAARNCTLKEDAARKVQRDRSEERRVRTEGNSR